MHNKKSFLQINTGVLELFYQRNPLYKVDMQHYISITILDEATVYPNSDKSTEFKY